VNTPESLDSPVVNMLGSSNSLVVNTPGSRIFYSLVMNTSGSLLNSILNTLGSLYSPAVNTPGSRICDSPVMNTYTGESRLLGCEYTGELRLPSGEYTGELRRPGSEYTGKSPLSSNNFSIIVLKSKLFLRMSNVTRRSCLTKKPDTQSLVTLSL
jgi:hypothetical protein